MISSNQLGFNSKIFQCVDRALNRLGEDPKQIVYWNYEREYRISVKEVAANTKQFVGFLYEMFGEGASTLEASICEEIRREFSISGVPKNATLDDLLDEAKKRFLAC